MGRRQDPDGTAQAGTAQIGTTKVRTAKASFSDLVLVCRKCAKRQGVDRKQIGRAVKRALRQGGRGEAFAKESGKGAGKVRLLETGCLGPCPKRMLTLATPDSLARRRVILVDPALDGLAREALVLAPAPLPAPSPAPLPTPLPAPGAA
ncbi:hypothetical protein, partial [Methylorubrum podarium]|uniref:hypothetical protein n=1 Tax=Methylorubrum podarium TaxID=200476 RepID=UPI001EE29D46